MDLLRYLVLLAALGVAVLLLASLLAIVYGKKQIFENCQTHDPVEVPLDQDLSTGMDWDRFFSCEDPNL